MLRKISTLIIGMRIIEEKLMKEYMLVAGIPRELYKEIIENVRKNSSK
jgi:uncharacterized protein YebE (UPF0316 family)